MCFFWKKRKAPDTQEGRDYTCLFCGGTFKAQDIEFAKTLDDQANEDYEDRVFADHLAEYKATVVEVDENRVGLQGAKRRFIDKRSTRYRVIKFETVPGDKEKKEEKLPLIVESTLVRITAEDSVQGDGLSYGAGNNATGNAERENTFKSDVRLCPHCHFTLPEGFATDKICRIGLLGGSRSGKTTYITVLTEYLRNRMADLNSGLRLARIEMLPECQKYQIALYAEHTANAKGMDATPIDTSREADPMVMPMVMRVTPMSKEYKPFFLILQDIPGEYLQPGRESYLINSNIPNSTDIIMLVDINQLLDTQPDNYFGGYCKQNLPTLLDNLNQLGDCFEKRPNSIQCTVTKLDYWQKQESERLEGACFIENCDRYHRSGISEDRLKLVDRQMRDKLKDIGDENQSGLLSNVLTHIPAPREHTRYTVIASRIVREENKPSEDNNSIAENRPQRQLTPEEKEHQRKEREMMYADSINVLEPILNICVWNHLLPVKGAEQNAKK